MKVGPYDLRFVEIFHELYALEQFMDSIESQLPDLIKKEVEKPYENLRRKKCVNDQSLRITTALRATAKNRRASCRALGV